MIEESMEALALAWRAFFNSESKTLPRERLEEVSQLAFHRIQNFSISSPPTYLRQLCTKATGQELVTEAASLRSKSQFPSILGSRTGAILASRLVLNWNILLIREDNQLILVFQGVTSCDAVLLPGADALLLICHIDAHRVANCIAILSRTPDFFSSEQKPQFGGYLVGHTRPYHCLYDGLLALEHIRQAGELGSNDLIFSKSDEAFLDLHSCLSLEQVHQRLDRESLNQLCAEQNSYLLQLGFWFNTRGENQELRQLAEAVDKPIRAAAAQHSKMNDIGAIEALKEYKPLLWIGITGQKRCWIEQVEGIAALLNTLYEFYPKLGIVLDGWTPPLASSDYHLKEIRNDNKVIQQIIRRLAFKTRKNIFITAGLPLLDKVRVGLEIDAFLTNYTTGSLVIARMCEKPGVGHMGRRMMASKHQHIHHGTREPSPCYVCDIGDPSTPTGYISYSIPWQILYNEILDLMEASPIRPVRQPKRMVIQDERKR